MLAAQIPAIYQLGWWRLIPIAAIILGLAMGWNK